MVFCISRLLAVSQLLTIVDAKDTAQTPLIEGIQPVGSSLGHHLFLSAIDKDGDDVCGIQMNLYGCGDGRLPDIVVHRFNADSSYGCASQYLRFPAALAIHLAPDVQKRVRTVSGSCP